jgi:capsular exopolysaccharide synthesis family protein
LAEGPNAAALFRSLKRRWMVAVTLGGALASLAAMAAWYALSPKFTAFSQVRVLPWEPSLMNGSQGGSSGFGSYIKSQAALIKSRPVLQAALKRDDVKRLNLESKHAEPVVFLEDELKIELTENSELLTIQFSSNDPVEATTLVKAVTDAYMDYIGYGEKHNRIQRVSELEKVYNETTQNLKIKKGNLKKLAENLGTLDRDALMRQREELHGTVRDLKNQRVPLRMEMVRAKSQLDSYPDRLKAIQEATISGPTLEQALEADPISRPLLTRVERYKGVIFHYEQIAPGSEEPTKVRAEQMVRALEKQVDKRRQELRVELKERLLAKTMDEQQQTRVQLENNIKVLNEQLARLQTEIDEQVGRLAKLGTSSNEIESLQAEITREEGMIDEIDRKRAHLQTDLRSADRITVHQEADLQKKDTKKQLMAAIGAPTGVLFLVCMGVAWVDYRQRRIHSASEVASGLGIRVVGAVPEVRALERHMIDLTTEPELEGHQVVESIDAIRTLLLHESQQETARVVMVTSAGPGEGKTTLAGHLASSLARSGRPTLLIDGDLRRPALHELFELPMQPGLSEVLLNEVELSDGIQETPQENLAVMTAGQWDREVLHALARDGLTALLDEVCKRFDFVIIDSHPVLAATDALLIGQRVDAVLLSVLRQVSQMPQVYAAAQRLGTLEIRVLGAVVNGADPNEVVLPSTAGLQAAPAAAA